MNYFPSPKNKLKFRKFDNEDFFGTYRFASIPFFSVHIFAPTSANLPQDCKENLNLDEKYFIVKQISVSNLVTHGFITNFVTKGLFYAVSKDAENCSDNFVSLSSDKLVLSFESNIARGLAIIKTTYSQRYHEKAHKAAKICIIDIKEKVLKPEKGFYEKLHHELKKIDHLKFDFILKWKPNENVCCESIRLYFEKLGIECLPCEPTLMQETTSYISVPTVDFESMDFNLMENVVEWLGTKVCGIKYNDDQDSYVSKFYEPEPSESRKMHQTISQGFFMSSEIRDIIKKSKNLFKADSSIPFVAVMCSGYQCCFVDSKDSHGGVSSADKLVCVLISPKQEYWMYSLNV